MYEFKVLPDSTFLDAVRKVIREELNSKEENDLKEKMLSPAETCKIFVPTITKQTLENYVKQGLVKKYYLGGLTWFKYSELIDSFKANQIYVREGLPKSVMRVKNIDDVYVKQILKKKGLGLENIKEDIIEQQRNAIKLKRAIKHYRND